MGNSTVSLQSIADYCSTLGELTPVLPTSGFSVQTALTIGTDVMNDLIAQRFNWKWNRMILPPFYTISWQQDYAGLTSTWRSPIGWLETGWWVDINNTSYPKPSWPIEIKRDIPVTVQAGNPTQKVDFDYNMNLSQDVWPGPNMKYTQPLGALITPTNPKINIRDANGNILVLTTFGTTGATPPIAKLTAPRAVSHITGYAVGGPGGTIYVALVTFSTPVPPFFPGESCAFSNLQICTMLNGQTLTVYDPMAVPAGVPAPNANQAACLVPFDFELNTDDTGTGTFLTPSNTIPEGTQVQDGSCVWTVADPYSQGFRIFPLPPQQGVVYQINLVAQMKAPPAFISMQQMINPVPDDHAHWFRAGFIAYCYRISPNPQMRNLFPQNRQLWLAAIEASMKQDDREQTDAGFFPDRTVIAPGGAYDIGPAWPFAPGAWWPGR